jgi:hypothetical protein
LGLDPEDFAEALENLSAGVEKNTKYKRQLTAEEVEAAKNTMVVEVQALHDLQDKFTDIKGEYGAKMKTKAQIIKNCVERVRYQQEQVQGDLYLMDDQDKGVMHYVTAEGEVVSTRPLMPSERQMRMKLHKVN